ncbi:MAG: hypothetical protein KME26_14910 [Oscillatoria princeps RMCB-10]|nr:hypothetical protein [Oscillatoria princeps RMCB-10]
MNEFCGELEFVALGESLKVSGGGRASFGDGRGGGCRWHFPGIIKVIDGLADMWTGCRETGCGEMNRDVLGGVMALRLRGW